MVNNRYLVCELKMLTNLIRRQFLKRTFTSGEEPISSTQSWVIRFIYENQGKDVFQRDIERKLKIRRSTATTIMQAMEKNGLIERRPVDYDARLKKLILTDKALNIYTQATETFSTIEGILGKGLSDEEIHEFYRMLDIMKANLEQPFDQK